MEGLLESGILSMHTCSHLCKRAFELIVKGDLRILEISTFELVG